jgi:hypothetical protein
VKKTSLDPRYDEENKQSNSTILAKQPTPSKASEEKEPAASIFHYSAETVLGG